MRQYDSRRTNPLPPVGPVFREQGRASGLPLEDGSGVDERFGITELSKSEALPIPAVL